MRKPMAFYDFFSKQTTTRLGERWMRQAAESILTEVSAAVSPLEKVLELGPGWGALAQVCHKRGLSYTAVDANLKLLRRIQPVKGICALFPPFPLRDAVCDVVVASHVIEHCNGLAQAQALLSEMFRIVRTGGCIVIVSPDLLWVGKYFWDCDYSHNFPTSLRRLYYMFVDQGLKIVKLQYVHNHLTGWKGYLLGWFVSILPYRVPVGREPTGKWIDRVYKLRLAFARSVQIIGRRPTKPLDYLEKKDERGMAKDKLHYM